MLTIHLHDVVFRSKQGVFAEEQILSNDVIANVSVSYLPQGEWPITNIEATLDYTALYQILNELLASPGALLETIVGKFAAITMATWPQVQEVHIALKKLHPAIIGWHGGAVGVAFTQKRA
ncbi:MAG: dihydroneopterin aldolase [Chitinophagaceae bacterium]